MRLLPPFCKQCVIVYKYTMINEVLNNKVTLLKVCITMYHQSENYWKYIKARNRMLLRCDYWNMRLNIPTQYNLETNRRIKMDNNELIWNPIGAVVTVLFCNYNIHQDLNVRRNSLIEMSKNHSSDGAALLFVFSYVLLPNYA